MNVYCGDFLVARADASFGNAWSACVRGTWVRGVTVPDSTIGWRIYRVRGWAWPFGCVAGGSEHRPIW